MTVNDKEVILLSTSLRENKAHRGDRGSLWSLGLISILPMADCTWPSETLHQLKFIPGQPVIGSCPQK